MPDRTYITSCRKVINIEDNASAVSIAFMLVLQFRDRRYCVGLSQNRTTVLYIYKFSTPKLFSFQNLCLGLILKIFLNGHNFQPDTIIKHIHACR